MCSGFILSACTEDLCQVRKINFNGIELKWIKTIDTGGYYQNQIVMHGDSAYIVDSGNNVVHKIDLHSLSLTKAFIDLGQNANPYALTVSEGRFYIVNSILTNVVSASLESPSSLEIVLDSGDLISPAFVTATKGSVIVVDSEFDYLNADNTKGTLIVIADGVKQTVKTVNPNPQFAYVIEDSLVVVCSGVTKFDVDYAVIPPEKSCLEVYNLVDLTQAPVISCVENTSLSHLTFTSEAIFAGSGTSASIHRFSRESYAFEHTIEIGEANEVGMTYPLAFDDSILAVSNFNHDSLSVVSASSSPSMIGTLKLSLTDYNRLGPIGLAFDRDRGNLFVVYSLAGIVDVFQVDFVGH